MNVISSWLQQRTRVDPILGMAAIEEEKILSLNQAHKQCDEANEDDDEDDEVDDDLALSFTNRGACHTSNKYVTISLIIISAITCFFCSFTDTFKDKKSGKLYFGIATYSGFHTFNKAPVEKIARDNTAKDELRLHAIDFIHAITSFTVFLGFALSDANVVMCFCPNCGQNLHALILNLPLALSSLASLIFFIFLASSSSSSSLQVTGSGTVTCPRRSGKSAPGGGDSDDKSSGTSIIVGNIGVLAA
ncbi:hypothetical protein MRB53_032399 [Persea americana]|uniref:Uncharacterized protein n=1 Tax=Persea americana TaxID=3435 RepID=A0ACC2KRQ4_PERAE|nr:hypothetical protein MRB53_032399 [Persea americana]